jgi:hypothetical protein
VSLKWFHYDTTSNEKVIIYAVEHENMTTGHIFTISETNVCHWRNNHTFTFLCKAKASEGQRKENAQM